MIEEKAFKITSDELKLLKDFSLTYENFINEIQSLRNILIKEEVEIIKNNSILIKHLTYIMTAKERNEFLALKEVLNDTMICAHATTQTLNNMIDRYSILIDKFLQQYELPENSVNDSLKN